MLNEFQINLFSIPPNFNMFKIYLKFDIISDITVKIVILL